VAWYLPDVNGKEPDFLLYGDDVGLVVFEVKDWALNQIQEANPFFLHSEYGRESGIDKMS
jgi:hypothetical protein